MRSLFKVMLVAAAMSISVGALAQDRQDTLKVNPDPAIKKTAKKVGHKTAEIAAKGAAKVSDQTYKGKVGPQGQTVYIDNQSRFYYINAKGKKVYVKRAELKDKSNQ